MGRIKKEVLRGLSAVLAFLLIVVSFGSGIANSYAGRINTVLGVSTSKVIKGEASNQDTNYYKSDYGADIYDVSALEQLEADAAREAIGETEDGVVLLKNDNNALPLAEGSGVSLFGNNTVNPNYSYHSTGNSMQELVTYVGAMKAVYDVNQDLISAYENSGVSRVKSVTDPVIGEAPASLYTDALKQSWKGDAAIVLLTREASEDCDVVLKTSEGISQLAMSRSELDMMSMLKAEKAAGNLSKIIVLINSNYAIELGWLDDYGVDACLWIGTPGIVGFTGVANVLTGKVSPSGKLPDTYAVNSLSAPAIVNANTNTYEWTNLDEVTAYCADDAKYVSYYMIYAEGIYVGYKYYETRYEDTVLGQGNASSAAGASNGGAWSYTDEVSYPFGYGLSYTTFEQKLDSVTYHEDTDTYTVKVTVTNTGDTAGKSVVQVYAQTPYGDYEKANQVEKAAVQLAAFDKTGLLEPGASETLEIEVERYLLASYDYTKAKTYILSAGDYYLSIGDDAHDALNNILAAKGVSGMVDVLGNSASGDPAKTYTWNQDSLDAETYSRSRNNGAAVTNLFDSADVNHWIDNTVTYLSRSDWEGTYPVPIAITATQEMMVELDDQNYSKPADSPSVNSFTQGVSSGLTFVAMKDVDYNDPLWETFIDQLTIEEMCSILPDQNGSVELTSVGLPASYRGDDMDCLEQVHFKANDKSGIVWPSSPLMAATFDRERIAARAALTGNEGIFMGCTEIWSGGPNFHRTQYCGRNNAYYSEDATLDYYIGQLMTENCQKYGVILGYKHLTLNDQEYRRESIATFANEQTIREIYMRAFEGAYSKAGCLGVMTAFNRVGLTYGGSCGAVLNDLLRGEWDFKGVVCSDAVVGMNYKTHYAENITNGLDYWCWDMAGFGPPPGGPGGEGGPGGPDGGPGGPGGGPGGSAPTVANGNSGTYDAGGTSDAVIYAKITEHDDGNLLSALRTAVKHQIYAETKTNLINGLDSNTTIVSVTPLWRTALTGLQIGLGVLTAASVALYGIALVKDGKKKEVK